MTSEPIRVLSVEVKDRGPCAPSRIFACHPDRFHPVVAQSLEEARDLSRDGRFHLVVSELDLPDGSALNLLGERGGDSAPPVLLVVDEGEEGSGDRAVEAGAAGYVVKNEQFLSVLPREAERALQRVGQRPEADTQAGPTKALMDALRESEKRFRELSAQFNALLDAIPDNLVLHSPGHEILWANRGTAAASGRELSDLIGRRCYQVWRRRDEACEGCPLETCFESGEPAVGCVVGEDGRYWELRAVPIRDEAGAVVSAVEVGRDVTEARRAQKQREALVDELARKNSELEQFAYTVSHDLKSHLTTVRGFVGLLERNLLAGDREGIRSNMGRITTATERMSEFVDGLLELSRIGLVTGPTEPVSLADVAREAEAMVGGLLSQRGVRVVISSDLPTVRGDRLRLRQVLENLLANAVRFAGGQPDPRVEVGFRKVGDEMVFRVEDNGVGVAPEDHERIFGLFEKADPEGEGTGIGLAIVKRLVEVHGGRVWVESEGLGRGSAFCFTLGTGREAGGE